mgnify:CR=1 FL=1
MNSLFTPTPNQNDIINLKGGATIQKDFKDFATSLTNEQIDYITGVSDEKHDSLNVKLSDPDAGTKISTFITAQSFKMSLRLLEEYHKWLSKQQ